MRETSLLPFHVSAAFEEGFLHWDLRLPTARKVAFKSKGEQGRNCKCTGGMRRLRRIVAGGPQNCRQDAKGLICCRPIAKGLYQGSASAQKDRLLSVAYANPYSIAMAGYQTL